MTQDVKSSFFHRVAKLYQARLSPRVVDEQDDLWSPKLDVLRFKAQQILANLMINQILRNVSPMLRWTQVVDQEEKENK